MRGCPATDYHRRRMSRGCTCVNLQTNLKDSSGNTRQGPGQGNTEVCLLQGNSCRHWFGDFNGPPRTLPGSWTDVQLLTALLKPTARTKGRGLVTGQDRDRPRAPAASVETIRKWLPHPAPSDQRCVTLTYVMERRATRVSRRWR
jgi:hypothetical protein